MLRVNTHEAKSRLSALLAMVQERHEEITICRNGKPVARLVCLQDKPLDPLLGDSRLAPVVFHEDPCAPLDSTAWPEEYR